MKSPYFPKASWKANELIHLEMIPFVLLFKVHHWIKNLFKSSEVRNFSLAGRLQYFLKHLLLLTENRKILQWVSCLRLQYLREALKNALPNQAKMNQVKKALGQPEIEAIEAMMRKRASHLVPS